METKHSIPPFNGASALLKVQMADDAWNTGKIENDLEHMETKCGNLMNTD